MMSGIAVMMLPKRHLDVCSVLLPKGEGTLQGSDFLGGLRNEAFTDLSCCSRARPALGGGRAKMNRLRVDSNVIRQAQKTSTSALPQTRLTDPSNVGAPEVIDKGSPQNSRILFHSRVLAGALCQAPACSILHIHSSSLSPGT
jgi:hypothetical protein